MRYVYPCNIIRDEEEQSLTGREAYNVSFPDVYGCNTGGWSWSEAVDMAIDALEVALSRYIDQGKDIPQPSAPDNGQVLIPVPPLAAAKLALYRAMRDQGVSSAELAKRLQVSEDAVRKMVDFTYRTRIRQIEIALLALGRALVTEEWRLDETPPQSPELIGSEAGALR
jgi:antitoxin HicB